MGEREKTNAARATAATVDYSELLAVFLRIGLLSFGGPAGQIALMHRMLIDELEWMSEEEYLAALNFCMLLPGPEAMQLATYAGWRLHGLKGGLAAGLLFVLPGAFVILALAMLYTAFGHVPLAQSLFLGVKAAVVAIVVEALIRISRRALKGRVDLGIAAAAFLAIYAFAVPFPLIVLAAAALGFVRGLGHVSEASGAAAGAPFSLSQTASTVAAWLVVWIVPLMLIAALVPAHGVLADLAWFFSKMAVVTFGGAYAVLAYVAQEGTGTYGWLSTGEMVDGLGLAETTPGPLILVNAFVGYLAAARAGGGADPSLAFGVAGWAVVLWATFAPCFLWIFAFAPHIARLNSNPRLRGALAAVTAAVVGVILNLTVWFALNVTFAHGAYVAMGPLHAYVPDLGSVNIAALGLSVLAAVLLFGLHRGLVTVLAVSAGASVALSVLGLS